MMSWSTTYLKAGNPTISIETLQDLASTDARTFGVASRNGS